MQLDKNNIEKTTIVISAVNIVEAGTLTVLKDCISYLSNLVSEKNIRVIAVIYDKNLFFYPNIEYIELKWPKKRWINRIWFEYISIKKISKKLGNVDLWFSLHDTTPSVIAKRKAVYFHNPFAFYKKKLSDFILAPKIALFSLFTKYIYRINVHKNDFLVVQQNWFRNEISKIINVKKQKIIVFPPNIEKSKKLDEIQQTDRKIDNFSFIFPASPNRHKNFEVICKATEILKKLYKIDNFKVYLTINGNENIYSRYLYKKWGNLSNIDFIGFLDKETLFSYYKTCDCLIFPSKVETWGLPISEFSKFKKPMLLADSPYAYETSAGSEKTAFFNPNNPTELAEQMRNLLQKNDTFLREIPIPNIEKPICYSWKELFDFLLKPI